MKKQLAYALLLSFFCAAICPVYAIELAPKEAPKTRLASLKSKFNASLKRLKRAIEIEDVETQRIVVKELFGIFRLILYAIGIGALIKYGLPHVLEQFDIRVKAATKGFDERIAKIMEGVDSRTKIVTEEANKTVAKISEEADKKIAKIMEGVDTRVKGVTEAVDIRINQVTKEADKRIAQVTEEAKKGIQAINDGAFAAIKKLKKEVHGTSITGPGGLQFNVQIPGVELPAKEKESKKEELLEEIPSHHIGEY